MYLSDDPAADWDRFCDAEEQELSLRPRCSICDDIIMDDECYKINDEFICSECIENKCRVYTENYIGEE